MDTGEEHVLVSERTTYFNAIRGESKTDPRRTASVGPGIMPTQWDLDEDEYPSESPNPIESDTPDHFEERRSRSSAAIPRSASAMPGYDDFRRSDLSRRQSAEDDEGLLHVRDLSLRDRGPSPAYTPRPDPLQDGRSRSSLRNPTIPSMLSPIASAAPSRATSDREDSTSTERRRVAPSRRARGSLASEPLMEGSGATSPTDREEDSETLLPTPLPASILENTGGRTSNNEVRFATSITHTRDQSDVEQDDTVGEVPVEHNRAASIRTMNSQHSASSSDHTHSQQPTETHPITSDIQTAANSPTPSPAPSIRNGRSTEHLPRSSLSSASLAGDGIPASGNNSGNESSRRSSLLGREGLNASSSSGANSPGRMTPPSGPHQEVRKGRKTRVGSASTIVINNDMPGPSRLAESRQNSERSTSSHVNNSYGPNANLFMKGNEPSESHEDRQHRSLKFSLASAFGVVKDRMSSKSRTRNGSRTASRAPSQAPSRTQSRAPSIDESSGIPPSMPAAAPSISRGGSASGFSRANGLPSAVPSYLVEDERTNRFQGRGSEDFVPGFGRGGAGRSVSTDRTASPARRRDTDRSPSRNRGRNKGMKVLTGALGVGDSHQEDDGESVHNWKEFKKGTSNSLSRLTLGIYNYPISFPIPVDSPPSLHAEFGSVVYRLKATVVRVGALTSNLVEETEVTMIATPQEDDLEETENVIVERQWEEQMRYQIALHGKAFPIGGIM